MSIKVTSVIALVIGGAVFCWFFFGETHTNNDIKRPEIIHTLNDTGPAADRNIKADDLPASGEPVPDTSGTVHEKEANDVNSSHAGSSDNRPSHVGRSKYEKFLNRPRDDAPYKAYLANIAHSAADEISEQLQLTAEQHEVLKSMLAEKTVVEYEIIKQDIHHTEKILQIDKNHYYFEVRIRGEFDSNTILAYEQFELEKATEFHQKKLETRVSQTLELLDNLSEAQREIIEQAYYAIDLPPGLQNAIGVYGTYYGRHRKEVIDQQWYVQELTRVSKRFNNL